MMTTDVKKLVLYFLIAATGLLLWQDWQKEHPSVAQNTETVTTQKLPSNVTPAQLTQNTAGSENTNTSASTTLIHAKTDLLDLKINPLGGTIVHAGLIQYPLDMQSKTEPFPLLSEDSDKLYIAENGISGVNNDRPIPYHVSKADYSLNSEDNHLQIDLTWSGENNLTLHKIITLTRGSYEIQVTNRIENNGQAPISFQWYNQLTRTPPQKQTGLLHTMTTFTGGAYSTQEKPYNKSSFQNLGAQSVDQLVKGGWIAMEQQYFLSAWIPNENMQNHFYSFKQAEQNVFTIGMLSDKQTSLPGTKIETNYTLYLGPELVDTLEKTAKNLKLTIDYGWFWFFSIAILWLMKHIYQIVGNWGWSIVLVTVLIKATFYHLSASSYRSMAKMRQLQPKIQALKDRFGADKQKFSQATMELYKTEKVNPFGGCLPILVQIPVFIALYWVLLESVELRQAPFILWIHDLAAPDPYFVLPLLMGATMFIQQKLSPPPPDPMQAKVMMFLPVIFTALFLNFPAGLVLYWTVNNTLSITQQWYVMRKLEKPVKK